MNDNSPNLLKNIDEVEVIMKKAEKMVDQEDKELEERKNNYISRSTRKRQREESGTFECRGTGWYNYNLLY